MRNVYAGGITLLMHWYNNEENPKQLGVIGSQVAEYHTYTRSYVRTIMAGAITIIRFLTSDLPTSVRAFRNGWKVAYNFSPLSLADDFRKGFIFCSCSIFPRRFPPIEASALGCIALSFERRLVDWVISRPQR